MWSARFSAVLMFALASGCAHEAVYRPAVLGASSGPAVRYPVPPESPKGDVFVTSFGFTDMEVGPGGQHASLLHARLAVGNGSPTMWAVDGRQQQLLVPGQPPLTAAFLNSDAGEGPYYSIPPGQSRVFDFYYAVSPPMDRIDALPSFALAWRVLAGAEAIVQRTPFQRVEETGEDHGPYPGYVFVGLGVSAGWWYGPFFPYHSRPIVRGYYYPPTRGHVTGVWRGTPPVRSGTGVWRGAPPARGGGGGWRGRAH